MTAKNSTINLVSFSSLLLSLLLTGTGPAPAAQTWYRQSGGTANLTNQVFTSDIDDTSGVFVTNGGILTMANCRVKTTGNTSNNDNSSFYGLNAGVLVKGKSQVTLTGCNIYTEGEGGNGVFSTDSGTSVILINDTIYCKGSGGHGVDATYKGYMSLTDVIIYTEESHGAAISTDRGGGTIDVLRGKAIAAGTDSPGIYCTGTITATDAVIGATGSEGVVIEGSNTVILNNVTMSGAKGTRNRANLIYQSMSGDAEGNKGVFTMTGGSFDWPSDGPFFLVTNTIAYITMKGVTINSASDTLIKAAKDNWGTSGKNGGETYFTAENQAIEGLVYCDNISSVSLTLKTGSVFTGSTNKAAVSIDETSSWSVTATSWVTTFTDASGVNGDSVTNVSGNGYTVYYDSTVTGNDYLEKKTYKLRGGGYLTCRAVTNAVEDDAETSAAVSIYPNPASSELTINTQSETARKYAVCNMLGENICEGSVSGSVTLDVSNWVSGVYFIIIDGKMNRVMVNR